MTLSLVFLACFLGVVGLGYGLAQRGRGTGPARSLDEWALGGRAFGVVITWFLVGGDFYTAYTVIAIPALVYTAGAYGFFALPYTIVVYPFVYAVMPRLWTACRNRGCVTAADYVRDRYGSGALATAVALTGLVATIPYIALQLVGIQVVLEALGWGQGRWPLAGAFLILALYTFRSGIKAPAMLAFGKDVMIYAVVIAAVAWIPHRLGGYGAVFAAAERALAARGGGGGLLLRPSQLLPYATMALGSALAAFMYPHTMTGVLSASSARTIRWNAILLPAYTVLLGLIALLGYMALAAGVHAASPTGIVPALFLQEFSPAFAGFAFAAVAIGALVPASLMAIGAANLAIRNLGEPLLRRKLPPGAETGAAKGAAIAILFAALAFVVLLPTHYAIDLQLIGGVWILQIFPAVVLGLFARWQRPGALLAGWAGGMAAGTGLTLAAGWKPVGLFPWFGGPVSLYIGLVALLLNGATVAAGSFLPRKAAAPLDLATPS